MKRLIGFLGAFALLLGMITATATPAQGIIGGTTVTGSPAIVSLWTMAPAAPKRNRCGATLIKPQWVVTAAHCWAGVLEGNQPEARIGTNNVSGYTARAVVDHFIHPDYDDELLGNDIMLLKLASPVPTSVQKPMRFTAGSPSVGTTGRIAGWGWPCQDLVPACTQGVQGPGKQLNVTVLHDDTCVSDWYPDTEFCIAATDGSHSMACFGDSGDPFYTKDAVGDFWWRGVVVYDGDDWDGFACADSAIDGGQGLGVVTEGYPYVPWMISTMAGL